MLQVLISKCRTCRISKFTLVLATGTTIHRQNQRKNETEEKVRISSLRTVDLLIMDLFQEISYRFTATSVLLTYFSLLELCFSILKLACDLTEHLGMGTFNHQSVSTDFSRNTRVLEAASAPRRSAGAVLHARDSVIHRA